MSAEALIELDTTPPEISFLGVNRFADSIGIAYEITEPQVIHADYIPDGYPSMEMLITKSALWCHEVPNPYGYAVVTVRDDVWNSMTVVIDVRMQTPTLTPGTGQVQQMSTGRLRDTTSRSSSGQEFQQAVQAAHRTIVRRVVQQSRVWSRGQEKRP